MEYTVFDKPWTAGRNFKVADVESYVTVGIADASAVLFELRVEPDIADASAVVAELGAQRHVGCMVEKLDVLVEPNGRRSTTVVGGALLALR